MRVVQALYWLRDGLKNGTQVDQDAIQAKLVRLLQDPSQGSTIRNDLHAGLHTVPSWMQKWIRDLFVDVYADPCLSTSTQLAGSEHVAA
jgi:hypothetical protein